MTILEAARLVIDLCHSRSEIRFIKPQDERTADDPNRRCPDIERARRCLGWQPVVPFSEGLSHTIAWFRERLGLR
jgi:nucleoside-diphosphate-sugar epimerase